MPLIWTVTIYTSAAAFLVAGLIARSRAKWLSAYLIACAPLSVVWAIGQGHVPYWTRPVSLALQLAAVIEAVSLMHRNCWSPRRRYLAAAFCGLLAIGGTFWTVEYPGYPAPLWWAQVWVEASCTGACFAALSLYRWWGEFRPAGWTIGNVAIMELYCAVELVALIWPTPQTLNAWLSLDLTTALIQDLCLLLWCCLYYRDL